MLRKNKGGWEKCSQFYKRGEKYPGKSLNQNPNSKFWNFII